MCSRVFWRKERMVARTMDLPYFDQPRIFLLPKGIENTKYSEYAWRSKYDSLVIKEAGAPDIVSEGMNGMRTVSTFIISSMC